MDRCLFRQVFTPADLARFAPRFENTNKKIVYSIIGRPQASPLEFTRWAAIDLPTKIYPEMAHRSEIEVQENGFQYGNSQPGCVEWHLNFADPHLFGFYGGSLYAQDEMQVMEHPTLGSLRDHLQSISEGVHKNASPLTMERDGTPTPCLVRNVERLGYVETGPHPSIRPYGLYGNSFRMGTEHQIRQSTIRLDPPTISNILAVAAPRPSYGEYTESQIMYILKTSFTGFLAAKFETESSRGEDGVLKTVVHTGNWGMGAFGGNRVLMNLLQMIAASLAEIDKIVFHTFSREFTKPHLEARQVFANLMAKHQDLNDMIAEICAMGYEWGVGDGN